MVNASLSVITVSAVSEADVRSGRVTLLLRLAGDATWRLIDLVAGIAVTAEGIGAIPITQAQQMHPQELKLNLAPMFEFDPPSSSALHITVSHLCEKSLLQLEGPCTLATGNEGAAASAAGLPLTAQVPVSDGGTPPGRPGAPEVVPLESHDAVAVRWAPPRDKGGSQVEGYVWVEPGEPHWPIELSHDGAGSLLAVLRGFGRATMLLPGAIAAVNAGGFSPPSAQWVGGIFGQPAPPRDVALSPWENSPGTTLRLDWQLPEGGWGGGFRIRHHRLRLWRLPGDGEGSDAATLRTARAAETNAAEAPRRDRWELAAVLRLRAGTEGLTPAEAAALAAESAAAAAGEAGQAAALRAGAAAEPRLENRTTASAAEVEAEAEAEVEAEAEEEAEAEVGPGGGRSVLLKGLRPGSRYAAQLVAVNSAGDESAAPPLCTAAELAAHEAPTSCAPVAVLPERGRELGWPRHGGLMLSGGLIGLLLLVAAACAFAARRRGSGRGGSASTSASRDGAGSGEGGEGRSVKRRDDHPQPLPPPAPPAPPTPPAAAPTRQRTLLYRATQPIWRVFAEDREGRGSASRAGAAATPRGATMPPRAAPTRQRTLLSRATRPIWRVFAEHRDDRGSGSPSPGGQIGMAVTV